jgi:hypothetical protein
MELFNAENSTDFSMSPLSHPRQHSASPFSPSRSAARVSTPLQTIIRTFGEKMIPLFEVELSPGRNVPGGSYEVIKQLPERGGEFEYRIKSMNEPHQRVVRESQLRKS